MTQAVPFADWAVEEAGLTADEVEALKLVPALEVLVSRIESAQARGARDPLAAVAPMAAGGNTRATTRRMLSHLGYTAQELRIVHRLMAGSTSGWPGLLRLYAGGSPMFQTHRDYVARQLRTLSPARK